MKNGTTVGIKNVFEWAIKQERQRHVEKYPYACLMVHAHSYFGIVVPQRSLLI